MKLSQRSLRWGALLLLMALSGMPAYARTHHTEAWARDRFAAAERMREALNGRPLADRTRHNYQRVLNAYRNVYLGAPTSTKADPSVVAVAETLVEMGRRFEDDKILNEAIAQYKFLRKEYPGSKYRCDALFTIGEIYKDDLNDARQARAVFQDFLHRYPHNHLVEDAQQAVVELDREAAAAKKVDSPNKPGREIAGNATALKDTREKGGDLSADSRVFKPALNLDPKADPNSDSQADAGQDSSGTGLPHQPRVTGIRHWSTPDYTRVAIDLEGEIKFGSQRIAHPDRIFFDLRNTKLASTLVGKSFDVDDGFLKKIRVAQFQPGRTRVVLEVDDLSDYDAFLLPNPYRLIIDIHGKDFHAKDMRGRDLAAGHGKALADETGDVEEPPTATSAVPTKAEGTKPDGSKSVPKSELKADLKALAGKPITQHEQLHESQEVVSKDNLATTPAGARTATGIVKKVVVEADDDDDENGAPAPKVAKLSTPSHSRSSASTSSKKDVAVDADSVPEEASATEPTLSNPAPQKASRLASKRGDLGMRGTGTREAKPTASGDRSLIRALGLKIGRIVIDPGHGGHDTGTIGPNGLQEKDLVLEVGRRLGKLLESRLGAEVVYTRKDDTFIPLETRTAIANQQRADLFISIHANSSHDPAARGVETYYLNFTSSPEALEVAARENAVSEKSIYELQDLVKKIALKEKIEESREFAGDVQESLHSGLAAKSPAIRDRGVKKAPFIVLIGANMPSILAEISFVSNPADEHRLETSEYRQRIAESLYRGIAKYVDGLSGVKMASKIDKAAGQYK
ncbi:MAG TPA: N-acetylmuramoyl-L-alanine amidase [Candidatus Sulfotelmatobacter sp.]|jgi:N-acetylmuramoyl-L-alanine amidase